jgi:ornithine carbamoyltransferase
MTIIQRGTDMNLKNKNFLKLLDFTPDEIASLLDLAADLKAKKKAGGQEHRPDL